MNDLKDLTDTLDGYSVEKTGFEIIGAHHEPVSDFWSLNVRAYKKEGKDFTTEERVCILTLVDRLESKYSISNERWAVVKVEELVPGTFNLVVKKVKNEEENSEDKKEHMEN